MFKSNCYWEHADSMCLEDAAWLDMREPTVSQNNKTCVANEPVRLVSDQRTPKFIVLFFYIFKLSPVVNSM